VNIKDLLLPRTVKATRAVILWGNQPVSQPEAVLESIRKLRDPAASIVMIGQHCQFFRHFIYGIDVCVPLNSATVM
jgi:hypothetical protein